MSGHHLFIHCRLLAAERLKITTKNGLEIESNLYTSMMGAKAINKTIYFLQTTGLGYRKIFGIDTCEREGKTHKEEEEDKQDTGFDVGAFKYGGRCKGYTKRPKEGYKYRTSDMNFLNVPFSI
jgi:hypothetical protein